MIYVKVDENNVVVLTTVTEPETMDGWIAAPEDVFNGMIYDEETGEFTNPAPPVSNAELKAELRRRLKKLSGITDPYELIMWTLLMPDADLDTHNNLWLTYFNMSNDPDGIPSDYIDDKHWVLDTSSGA